MQPEMTLRDHFAAAALTGLLARQDINGYSLDDDPRDFGPVTLAAYKWADAMLRERATTIHDAAPAVKAGTPGTGDTPEIAAFRRFVGQVMNWISEATGFLHDDVLRTDDARDFIHNACMRCWDAFDRIASPTDHGASPEARASGESVVPQPTPRGDSDRTDKAAPRPSEGTGDTPATHATHGEGSMRREGIQEPAAWGVAGSRGLLYATSVSRMDAVDMQSEHECYTHVVPLYRHPPVTEPLPKTKRAEVSAEPAALYVQERADLQIWLAECLMQARTATEGCNEELAERWQRRAKRAAAMIERLGGGR